jgi:hypothetical protein
MVFHNTPWKILAKYELTQRMLVGSNGLQGLPGRTASPNARVLPLIPS